MEKGLTDDEGAVMWTHKEGTAKYSVELLTGQRFDIDVRDLLSSEPAARLGNAGYRAYTYEGSGGVDAIVQGDDFRRLMAGDMNTMKKA
jgi:type VI secretion system secreted protein VgrG